MEDKENEIIKILKNDGIGIMPTDTLYGLVGSAFSRKAINRIYKIKNRDKKKKMIVLISSIKDLEKFGISNRLIRANRRMLEKVWSGKVSVILNNIAFRLPAKKSLVEILKKTGPLVAPSANPEGLKPAENIKQAKEYFGPVRSRSPKGDRNTRMLAREASNGIGNNVDFYLSGGTLKSKPSTLIKINKKGEIEVLRGNI
ncbi:MAG: Sua5/YciO/YrdC/YwlC family protein [Candidatus Paceibacterota bacterium]|jgi:L-threonylcarbamoyladenylate synthase